MLIISQFISSIVRCITLTFYIAGKLSTPPRVWRGDFLVYPKASTALLGVAQAMCVPVTFGIQLVNVDLDWAEPNARFIV